MPTKKLQRKNFPGTRGFTLVELMVVIIIIGVVSSMSVPPLFRYVASHRLQTNTDRFTTDMQYARSIAISNAQIVNLSTTLTNYTLRDALTGEILRQVEFDTGLSMDSNHSVQFYPWGMADDQIFKLSSAAGAYHISLLPTGIVEVTRP